MKKFHILVVDDDQRIRDLLKQFLIKHGYVVTAVYDAQEARAALDLFNFDLVILDVMLPKEKGTDFAKQLRGVSKVAILMLTALGEVKDRITGFESGVDDYVVKPFEPKELLFRIRSLIQRTSDHDGQIIHFGSAKYDSKKNVIIRDDSFLALTSGEGKLLRYLLDQKNELVEREELSDILGVNERSVDVQINRLRGKIEVNPKQPLFLQSIRGKGYILYAD